jgi:hypothetical protein
MAHRHYGLRAAKPPPASEPASFSAWNGGPFIAAIIVMVIVLCIVLYGIVKTVTDVANNTTSAPRTVGQGMVQPDR